MGAAARRARSDALDGWLARLLRASVAGAGDGPDANTGAGAAKPGGAEVDDLAGCGVALMAVGGLGRQECMPYGDLDLLLLHDGQRDVAPLADRLWYPIWDAKLRLDHAVRTVPEALTLASADVKVALGLLDGRWVAGDSGLVTRLRAQAAADWRAAAGRRLPELRELTRARWAHQGELAFLLEGDVKEARGGLRDVAASRAIGWAQVADVSDPMGRRAQLRMLDVREALHQASRRRQDRLLAEQQQPVAEALGLADRDRLLQRVADDARAISYACDDAWRAADRWLSRRARRGKLVPRWLADGVMECDGEVTLSRGGGIAASVDAVLPLRVASLAATHRLPIARATLRRLETAPPLPYPWPAEALRLLTALLGAGAGLAATWEACDRHGLVERWLPEWRRVRSLPQRNPAHLHTVDRHLVQSAAKAAELTREVSRPDLLLLAALLHDVGKGLPGDHSQQGVPIARQVCRRIGLSREDTELVCRLVRRHLLLADTATRRDLSDPATVELVVGAVTDSDTLDLLYALTRADAAATGPLAWSDWKAGLVAELVRRARRMLDTGQAPGPASPDPALTQLARSPLPAVRVRADRVWVAARRRRGLLASVAGVLAVHKLEVLSADATTVGDRAVVECAVRPTHSPPDPELLAAELRRAARGPLRLADRVRARDTSRSGASPAAAEPRVVWFRQASNRDTVVELRAADAPGLLYRVTRALDQVGVQVRAARISTLGGDVVDAFYLSGDPPDEARVAEIESAVLAAARAV
ncbi:MAG: [protein-PII] uridylyltransferase [Micromonosporaceae bacterium]